MEFELSAEQLQHYDTYVRRALHARYSCMSHTLLLNARDCVCLYQGYVLLKQWLSPSLVSTLQSELEAGLRAQFPDADVHSQWMWSALRW